MIRATNNTRPKIYSDLLPPLTPVAYESLRQSIAEIGVQDPVIEDDKGGLIDGRHRQRACDELGTTCPRIVRHFANEAEKYELALRLNCQRRHLNRKQKRSLIEAYLLADPAIADNTLAEVVGGISKNTVADVRAQLERTCQIDKLAKTRGKDGKLRPRKYARIVANTTKEVEAARKAIKELPPSFDGKIIDATTAARQQGQREEHNGDDNPPDHEADWDQTPEDICKRIIALFDWSKGELVLEPFCGDGNFYRNLPQHVRKDWCEIRRGRDFFDYAGPRPRTILSNPPFRDVANGNNLVVPCLEGCLQLATHRVIYFVSHKVFNALTPVRLAQYAEWGWSITHLSIWDVRKWYGRYYLLVWERNTPSIIQYFPSDSTS